jgi:hypothetical protein
MNPDDELSRRDCKAALKGHPKITQAEAWGDSQGEIEILCVDSSIWQPPDLPCVIVFR